MFSNPFRNAATKSNRSIVSSPTNAFLSRCNWSYPRENHINVNQAVEMLRNYDSNYMPFYIRIFNELPKAVLESFIQEHNIAMSQINTLYLTLRNNTHRRLKAL